MTITLSDVTTSLLCFTVGVICTLGAVAMLIGWTIIQKNRVK